MLIQSIQGAELDLENARKAYNRAVKEYNVGFQRQEFRFLEADHRNQAMLRHGGPSFQMTESTAQGLGEQGKAIFETQARRKSSPIWIKIENPHGPISRAELHSLIQTGMISNDTNVLKAGSGNWTKYKDL